MTRKPDDHSPCKPDAETGASHLPPVTDACRLVQMLAGEMVTIAGERSPLRRNRRRTHCHTRQIAMYVCHVALQIPQSDVGAAFGKDRSTVGYACGVVEDRRDDRAFDDFVAALERIARGVFLGEEQSHG